MSSSEFFLPPSFALIAIKAAKSGNPRDRGLSESPVGSVRRKRETGAVTEPSRNLSDFVELTPSRGNAPV
jgi:hypothetical protein